ncbi:MAG: DUF6301 family protein [Pseudolysinimonas sp.]|uniref:DUF6301 family protein n=1 Tax=Pseudolysinimonas sp. TaxID=2680009 RepID=UPI0032667B17
MKDLDGFAVAEADDVRPILEAFGAIIWPAPAETAAAFAAQLGWQMTRPRAAQTTLAVSWREAGFVMFRGDLDEIQFSITDSIPLDRRDDPATGAVVRAAHAAEKKVLKDLLGEPTGSRGGTDPSVWWDLPSGGRVQVKRLPRSVLLKLQSKHLVDLARSEARLGINPDRVYGVDG